jgi:hypothetical protein
MRIPKAAKITSKAQRTHPDSIARVAVTFRATRILSWTALLNQEAICADNSSNNEKTEDNLKHSWD